MNEERNCPDGLRGKPHHNSVPVDYPRRVRTIMLGGSGQSLTSPQREEPTSDSGELELAFSSTGENLKQTCPQLGSESSCLGPILALDVIAIRAFMPSQQRGDHKSDALAALRWREG